MEKTSNNKLRFFALYWGQNVLREQGKRKINEYVVAYLDQELPEHWLDLKSPTDITDEDALEIAKIEIPGTLSFHNADNGRTCVKSPSNQITLNQQSVDYLRSKGYALPWMDLSIADIVDYGWIKIK